MAQNNNKDDGEFWLPPEFLTDDDVVFMEKKHPKQQRLKGADDLFCLETDFGANSLFSHDFPFRFGYLGVSSDLSSPVESAVSSTETESDDEDHLARMPHTTLDDDFTRNAKHRVLSGSPHSTLCGVGNSCRCRSIPNRAVSSQPPRTRDLLCAAAGEVAKMKINGGGVYQQSRGVLGGGPPSPVTVPGKTSDSCGGDPGYYPTQQSLSYHHQLQAAQFHQQQQMVKQQSCGIWGAAQSNKVAAGVGLYQQQKQLQQSQAMVHHNLYGGRSNGNPVCLPNSAWPSLQQAQAQAQHVTGVGPGMRAAVFLGNPGGKRECAGTGVFLPRRNGAPVEPRNKSASSTTVLLPARVVQALELNLEKIRGQPLYQGRVGTGVRFAFDNDSLVPRNGGDAAVDFLSTQKQSFSSKAQQAGVEVEVRLPQEWTY